MRRMAGTRRLRELAAEFGVSHETIRAICRRERDTSHPLVPTDAYLRHQVYDGALLRAVDAAVRAAGPIP